MTGRRALWILGTVLNRCVLRPEVVSKSQIRDSYGSMLRHHDTPPTPITIPLLAPRKPPYGDARSCACTRSQGVSLAL